MTELIITEKPQAALKIATALADNKPVEKKNKQVKYYELKHKGKEIIVGCAVGHLFTIGEITKKNTYPAFDVEWQPSHLKSKNSAFTKIYLTTLKSIAKKANEFTVATDYDLEGSVIGFNVVRHALNKKDAKRMKFSTLTKDELIESYENASKHLDFERIEAGETRHILDYFYGISTSRALTNSISKATKGFKLMSTGRVQGPTLKLIVDKELEIKKFIPTPYWEIELLTDEDIKAQHEEGKFLDEKKAKQIHEKCKNNNAIVKEINKKKQNVLPPFPFDLTALQTEVFATLRIKPRETLQIAQNLYLAGLISYPRTSSNQLPKAIGYNKIIQAISKQPMYRKYCQDLLKKPLVPNNGKKKDPAHPAIYPTGEIKKLQDREARVYDLIVRRTLACFSEKAVKEIQDVKLDVNKEIFLTKGSRVVIPGWYEIYAHFVRSKDIELPALKEKQELNVKSLDLLSKETQPPKRYTASSIIKKMETLGLGTKATRSSIVDTLFDRGYVSETTLEATTLGIKTIETLQKYSPKIIDVKLTEHFEKEMEEIQKGKRKESQVLEEAKKTLTKIFEKFRENEKKIGLELGEASIKARDEASTVGSCNKCKEGNLQIRRGKYGFFIACNKYPDCENLFNLPSNALVVPANKTCETCNFPVVKVIKSRKRPQEFCINKDCKTRHVEEETPKLDKDKQNCPNCGKPFALRQSFYGKFYGCTGYPKCKTMMKLDGTIVEYKAKKKTAKKKTTKKKAAKKKA